ncbi:hypothetical protein [Streptomyces sp. NPDC006552]|uniref:hypothetical protein n=1 Tax=Streptomyces sp. NPDC006552 TaxID=3157179 RepID=UPI0033BC1B39
MSGRENAGLGSGTEIEVAADHDTGLDVPRVPTSAGAWGTGSAQALQDSTPDALIGGDLGNLGTFGDLGVVDEPGEFKASGDLDRAGGLGAEGPAEPGTANWADGSRPGAGRGRDAGAPGAPGAGFERTPGIRVSGALGAGAVGGRDAGAPGASSTGVEPTPDIRAAEILTASSGRARDVRVPRAGAGTGVGAGANNRSSAARSSQRRTGVDPVKALMHRHRALCERAVDPLEIAAGLEAHGVTDRAAARFRHKDVFSLAEELYARVPRDGDRAEATVPTPAPTLDPAPTPGVRGAWTLLALVPGAVCALTLFVVHVTTGTARWSVAIGGTLAGAAALHATLRRGPLHAHGSPAPTTPLWAWWLLAYALFGDGLLTAALTGGPDEIWAPATAPLLALTVAVAPAAWCARLYGAGAGRRLATSRGLADFTASARPLLLGIVILFASALIALLGLAGALLGQRVDYAGAGALGLLLLLARLLTAHGRTHAPAVVLGAATALEAVAVASVFAARLPGCAVLSTPVEAAVTAMGAGIVPATACGAAALVLLVHALRTLARASAHARAEGATGGAP